jgi:DNA-binding NarL/FixJ family response regulator
VRVLRDEPGIRLIGEAAGGGDALATIVRTEPDVVLLDLGIGGALDVLRTTRSAQRPPRVVALGFGGDGDEALAVAEAGVPLIVAGPAVPHGRTTYRPPRTCWKSCQPRPIGLLELASQPVAPV